MVKRSKGSLSKATKRIKKERRVTVSAITRKFEVGDGVFIKPIHIVSARPPKRYAGRHGQIVEKRGSSYVVEIADGSKRKRFITTALHLAAPR